MNDADREAVKAEIGLARQALRRPRPAPPRPGDPAGPPMVDVGLPATVDSAGTIATPDNTASPARSETPNVPGTTAVDLDSVGDPSASVGEPAERLPPPTATAADDLASTTAGVGQPGESRLTTADARALMSAGAERDRLEERVAELEAEVGHLREALAGVLDAAASGLRPRRRAEGDEPGPVPDSLHAEPAPRTP